jgi:hypothetical protein
MGVEKQKSSITDIIGAWERKEPVITPDGEEGYILRLKGGKARVHRREENGREVQAWFRLEELKIVPHEN